MDAEYLGFYRSFYVKVMKAKQAMRNYLKIIFILIFPHSKDLFLLNSLAPVPVIKV